MPESHNLTAMAEALATLMSDDLDVTVPAIDVLDWLALAGLTLRPDDGDAIVAYNLALDDELPTKTHLPSTRHPTPLRPRGLLTVGPSVTRRPGVRTHAG